MKRSLLALGLLVVAGLVAACGGASAATGAPAPSTPAGSPGAGAGAITISAKDLKFSTDTLAVPADEAFDLTFDNQEGAPHNVAIYSDPSASVKIFVGEIFTGPAAKTATVQAMPAGSYFFRCDIHPDMKGTVTAS